MIKVKNLTITLGKQKILKNIDCSLTLNKITCFIGKSGAGKTTLLKSLAHLVPTESGVISLDGFELKNLTQKEKSEAVGYVFQDFNLFNHLTVLENCTSPLLVHGMSREKARERAHEELNKLGMDSFGHKYPSQISGGQKQRVAIARSLGLRPKVLLFDEPTASLDPINTQTLVSSLQSLVREGLTIGLVSQDIAFIKKVADRIYLLESGKIIDFFEGKTQLGHSKLIENFLLEA